MSIISPIAPVIILIAVMVGAIICYFYCCRQTASAHRNDAHSLHKADIHAKALEVMDGLIFGGRTGKPPASKEMTQSLDYLRRMLWLHGSDAICQTLSDIYALAIAEQKKPDDQEKMFSLYHRFLLLLRRDLRWQKHSKITSDCYLRSVVAGYDQYTVLEKK